MSKRSLFWGNASGKLGEAVFYRAGGEQRTRTYVEKIKNPRTSSQATQRCKLNNLTAFYRSVASFIKQVNQPEKASMSAFNQFVKNNSSLNGCVANKSMIDKGYSVPYRFNCSRGDLNVPTRYDNPLGEATINLDSAGVGIDLATASNPYRFTLSEPLPLTEFEGTNNDGTSGVNKRGFLYGKEFYQVFAGGNNVYGLPASFAVFIICSRYADEGFVSWVMGVECSADSNDKLHLIASSNNAAVEIGEPSAYLRPINGTLTAGSASATMKLQGTTMYYLQNGDTESDSYSNDFCGICVAYRDEKGIHASPCNLIVPAFVGDAPDETVSQFFPTGEVGKTILSEYTISTNTLV